MTHTSTKIRRSRIKQARKLGITNEFDKLYTIKITNLIKNVNNIKYISTDKRDRIIKQARKLGYKNEFDELSTKKIINLIRKYEESINGNLIYSKDKLAKLIYDNDKDNMINDLHTVISNYVGDQDKNTWLMQKPTSSLSCGDKIYVLETGYGEVVHKHSKENKYFITLEKNKKYIWVKINNIRLIKYF